MSRWVGEVGAAPPESRRVGKPGPCFWVGMANLDTPMVVPLCCSLGA